MSDAERARHAVDDASARLSASDSEALRPAEAGGRETAPASMDAVTLPFAAADALSEAAAALAALAHAAETGPKPAAASPAAPWALSERHDEKISAATEAAASTPATGLAAITLLDPSLRSAHTEFPTVEARTVEAESAEAHAAQSETAVATTDVTETGIGRIGIDGIGAAEPAAASLDVGTVRAPAPVMPPLIAGQLHVTAPMPRVAVAPAIPFPRAPESAATVRGGAAAPSDPCATEAGNRAGTLSTADPQTPPAAGEVSWPQLPPRPLGTVRPGGDGHRLLDPARDVAPVAGAPGAVVPQPAEIAVDHPWRAASTSALPTTGQVRDTARIVQSGVTVGRATADSAIASDGRTATVPRAPSRPGVGVLRRIARVVLYAFVTYMIVALVLIGVFRFVDPPTSALMLLRRATGEQVTHSWAPIEAISPQLWRAVILSEDGNFCRHHGIDFGELKAAIERARDGIPRGASTITMQVAKNLLLWPAKSYVRKAIEVPLTLAIEAAWPKRRILEVYLNIAEWGPGIYGAEAAARHHFDHPAARLTASEAALLAVSLPNPIARDAGDPGPGTERLSRRILARMSANPRAASCVAR